MGMNVLDWIAFVLVMIGGLNWGLYGLFKLDLVQMIAGVGIIADVIYTLVGIAAVYMIVAMIVKKD